MSRSLHFLVVFIVSMYTAITNYFYVSLLLAVNSFFTNFFNSKHVIRSLNVFSTVNTFIYVFSTRGNYEYGFKKYAPN